jgi:hypothetical protein
MGRKELDDWLMAEDSGQDNAADTAFAHLFATIPKAEPHQAFLEQAVATAWRWRARRRRLRIFAWAAVIALVIAGGVTAYLASPLVGRSAIKALAFLSGHAVPWLIAYVTVAMNGWLTLGHVGAVIAAALITPGRVVAVVGVELVGILTFYALQRIASAERLGDVQA